MKYTKTYQQYLEEIETEKEWENKIKSIVPNVKLEYTSIPKRLDKTNDKWDASAFHYLVTMQRDAKEISFCYSKGSAHCYEMGTVTKPIEPMLSEVLYSLILDCTEESFDYFCSEFGYDNDSIKAYKTYESCLENTKKLKTLFTYSEIEALKELFQDY